MPVERARCRRVALVRPVDHRVLSGLSRGRGSGFDGSAGGLAGVGGVSGSGACGRECAFDVRLWAAGETVGRSR
jgi:hypothetical protein